MNKAASRQKSDPEKPKSWPRFVLRVDHEMCSYLTSGKKTKLGLLSSSLKVWILLKVVFCWSLFICILLFLQSLSVVTVGEVTNILNTLQPDRQRFLPWCFWTTNILREGQWWGQRKITRLSAERCKPQTVCFSYQEVDEPCKASEVNLLQRWQYYWHVSTLAIRGLQQAQNQEEGDAFD